MFKVLYNTIIIYVLWHRFLVFWFKTKNMPNLPEKSPKTRIRDGKKIVKQQKDSSSQHSEKTNITDKKGYNEDNETQPTATDNKKKKR